MALVPAEMAPIIIIIINKLRGAVAMCVPIWGFSLHRLCAASSIYSVLTLRFLSLHVHHEAYKFVDEN
jgi:hypothetical protein